MKKVYQNLRDFIEAIEDKADLAKYLQFLYGVNIREVLADFGDILGNSAY